jgi:ATP-dependent RNA helicase DeaD
MTQEQRNRVMKRFRSEASDLLIATDVAARGLDIQHLSHVINFDVPAEAASYVHRIGRVGRAGREGVAITLAEPREHRQIRSIEQMTGQKIEIAKVPTVADLRARRLELSRASVREAIVDGDLDRYRVVVESLAAEFDLMDVAMGAVKLLHQANGAENHEDDEIPEVELYRDKPPRAPRKERARDSRGDKRPHGESRGGLMTRLYVGAGRAAGVRAQDLVGAITGEAGLTGRQVGDIDISDRFSLVEVPEDLAEAVITALRASKIKGRKVTVRRERPRK